MNASRIWIVLTIIVVVAGYGVHHKVQRVTAPAQQGALFK
jgi:purine-cytosine permease-like protein